MWYSGDMDDTLVKKSTWGGVRPNSGRPFGSLSKKTQEQKIIDEEFKGRILNSVHELLTAQFNIAKGTSYLYRIDEIKDGNDTKKVYVLVDDPREIENVLNECEGTGMMDNHYYYITTKEPDNRALDSLFDRVFGKAPQKIEGKITALMGVISGMQIKKD